MDWWENGVRIYDLSETAQYGAALQRSSVVFFVRKEVILQRMERHGKENLRPVQSTEEARERGRNGGIASGKARRRKRAMRDAAKLLLDMPVKGDSISKALKAMGFDEKDLTNQVAMLVSMWKEAMEGSVSAATFLRDTAGQKVEQKQVDAAFEYKKERDAGITQELEDMEDIEGEIYGKG